MPRRAVSRGLPRGCERIDADLHRTTGTACIWAGATRTRWSRSHLRRISGRLSSYRAQMTTMIALFADRLQDRGLCELIWGAVVVFKMGELREVGWLVSPRR